MLHPVVRMQGSSSLERPASWGVSYQDFPGHNVMQPVVRITGCVTHLGYSCLHKYMMHRFMGLSEI
jgi:hypothetical protein